MSLVVVVVVVVQDTIDIGNMVYFSSALLFILMITSLFKLCLIASIVGENIMLLSLKLRH